MRGVARAFATAPRARASTATRARMRDARAMEKSSVNVRGERRRGTTTPARASAEAVFAIATAMVVPTYCVMIARPNSRRVLAAVESRAIFWALGALYAHAAWKSLQSADVFEAARGVLMNSNEGVVSRFVTLVSEFLATAETATSAWVHLLSLDLFVARFVYVDGAKYSASVGDLAARVPVRHSLILCMMFGPLGLMSHAVTRWIWNTFVTTDVI